MVGLSVDQPLILSLFVSINSGVNEGLMNNKDNPAVLSDSVRVPFFVTLWTIAHQAPLSMGFSRQEYWSGLPFPPPGQTLLYLGKFQRF